jgi:hypothetical protein
VSQFCVSEFGDVFASIGVREPQPTASEAFTIFGEAHRKIERYAITMLKTVKPVSVLRSYFSLQEKTLTLLNAHCMFSGGQK